MDYELSDEIVYGAMMKAKGMVGGSKSAMEMIDLVKLILDHEIDAIENVQYVVSGLYRRTVFEYAKRRIGCER